MALVFKLIKIFRTHKIYIFTVLILLLCVEHLTWRNSRQITSRIYDSNVDAFESNATLSDGSNQSEHSITSSTDHTLENNKWSGLLQCQEKRLSHLRQQCDKLGFTSKQKPLESYTEEELKNLTTSYICDDKHMVILRTIAKAGCTSWKNIILNNTLFSNNTTKNDTSFNPHNRYLISKVIGYLSSYSKVEIIWRLKNYFNIITVRHPLTRLESIILNLWMRFGHQDKYQNVTISEFFQKSINALANPQVVNVHWMNFTDYAYPCLIPYSFISKIESANDEMEYIIKNKLSGYGDPVAKNQIKDKQIQHEDISSKFKSYFIDSDNNNMNGYNISNGYGVYLPMFSNLEHPGTDLLKLMRVYGADMHLFGYGYQFHGKKIFATCEGDGSNGSCC